MLVRECEYEEQVWYKCGGVWTGSQTIALGTLAQQRHLEGQAVRWCAAGISCDDTWS